MLSVEDGILRFTIASLQVDGMVSQLLLMFTINLKLDKRRKDSIIGSSNVHGVQLDSSEDRCTMKMVFNIRTEAADHFHLPML